MVRRPISNDALRGSKSKNMSRDKLLSNLNRRTILHLLHKNGSMDREALMAELGLKNGVLVYHLNELIKYEYAERNGDFYKLYIPPIITPEAPVVEEIIEDVQEVPEETPIRDLVL